jgi:hypothetical protein
MKWGHIWILSDFESETLNWHRTQEIDYTGTLIKLTWFLICKDHPKEEIKGMLDFSCERSLDILWAPRRRIRTLYDLREKNLLCVTHSWKWIGEIISKLKEMFNANPSVLWPLLHLIERRWFWVIACLWNLVEGVACRDGICWIVSQIVKVRKIEGIRSAKHLREGDAQHRRRRSRVWE